MYKIVWVEKSGATGLLCFSSYGEANRAYDKISTSETCVFARWSDRYDDPIHQYAEPL